MRLRSLLALVISVGCGNDDGGGSTTPLDAPPDMAKPIDAAIWIDAPPAPAGHAHFVIDQQLLPETNLEARTYGLELNGDQAVDNQLGMVLGTLAGMGFEIQAVMDKSIDTGAALTLADVGADDLTAATTATFTLYKGANPMPTPCVNAQDTVCRKHLAGTGSFTIDPTAPKDTPLVGSITAGKLTAGPGHLTIQFTMADTTPIMLTLIGARVELTAVTPTMATGKLGGGISMNDINTKLLPGMRDNFQAKVMKECTMLQSPPTCGCPTSSDAKTLLGLFDTTPQDCTISLSEVQNNSLIISLFAPDITVEAMQAMSFGMGVHAVTGGFVAP